MNFMPTINTWMVPLTTRLSWLLKYEWWDWEQMNLKISDKSADLEWNPWNPWIYPRNIQGNPCGFIHKNAWISDEKRFKVLFRCNYRKYTFCKYSHTTDHELCITQYGHCYADNPDTIKAD